MAEGKQNIIDALVESKKYSRLKAETFSKKMFGVIKQGLLDEGFVKVKGLGTFKLITVGSRQSVDVNSKQKIEIAEHQRLVFTPDASLKAKINRPFDKFETVILDDDIDLSSLNTATQTEKPDQLVMEGIESFTLEKQHASQAEETSKEDIPTIESKKEKKVETLPVQTIYLKPLEEVNEPEPIQEESKKEEEQHPESNDEKPQDEPAEDTTKYDTEDFEVDEETPNKWLKIIGYILGILLLMAGSYIAGYQKLIDISQFMGGNQPQAADTLKAPQATIADVDSLTTLPSDSLDNTEVKDTLSEPTPEQQAQAYEQMPEGEYLIVGTEEEIEFKIGNTLQKLANKYYGDTKLWPYIVFYNHIQNPDVIGLNAKIKIPKLVRRQDNQDIQ